jgi:hypothetical protein
MRLLGEWRCGTQHVFGIGNQPKREFPKRRRVREQRGYVDDTDARMRRIATRANGSNTSWREAR